MYPNSHRAMLLNREYILADEIEQLALGAKLALATTAGSHIFLTGDLGSGKTTLVRGFLQGLGYTDAVKSPTYTLVETYQIANKTICHFDLYRLQDANELIYIGVADYFNQYNIVLVEWPSHGAGILPAANLLINLTVIEVGRQIQLQALDNIGVTILQQLEH